MGPRRQLGLSITFVDDDEVMGDGKGSPLGIAAIALVGDDATAPSRSVAVVTPPSDERWAEPLWSAPKMPQIQVIVEADALLPKELLVRVLALLDAKEVSAVATANASFKALCDEPHVLLERAAAAVPRDEKAARVLYERVADEPRASAAASVLHRRLDGFEARHERHRRDHDARAGASRPKPSSAASPTTPRRPRARTARRLPRRRRLYWPSSRLRTTHAPSRRSASLRYSGRPSARARRPGP